MKLDLTDLTKKAKLFFMKQRAEELERAIKRSSTNERKIELIELLEDIEHLEKEEE